MAEQDILFFLDGDAQGAMDALTALIGVVGQLDSALQGLAGSLSVLNDITAALTAIGADDAPIAAVTDSLATLSQEIDTTAASAPILKDGLAGIAQAESDVEAATSRIAQVMNDQASAMVAQAAAADAAMQSLTGLVSSQDALLSSSDAVVQAATDMVAGLTDEDFAMGLTADQANIYIDALIRLGATETEAASLLDSYTVACQQQIAATAPLADMQSALADKTVFLASSYGVATDAAVAMAISQANLTTGMMDFGQAVDAAVAPLDAQASAEDAATQAGDQLNAVYAAMMTALSEGSNMFNAVNDALNLMGDAGISASDSLTKLAEAAAFLNIDLTDVLNGVQDVRALMGDAAASTDTFTSSFTNAQLAVGLFGTTLSSIPGEVEAATAAMGGMTAATEEVTAASESKNAVLKEQTAATQGDAYMILVLLQFLLQAVGGFVKLGTSAQDSIAKLSGLADQSLAGASGLSRLNGVVTQLEADSIKFGMSLTATSDGLYHIMSSGFNTSDSLLILKSSMEASSATGANMTEVSSALTSILNAYGLSAKSASLVTNEMVQSVVSGNMTMTEYANSIGNLAAVAHQAGFSFVEATSALSELTQVNHRARQDGQNLAATFIVLGTEADKTAAAAKGLGIGFNESAYKSMDLIEKLQYLAKIAGGDNTEAFRKLLLNSTAARTGFELLANGGKNLATVMTAVAGNTTALDIAFSESEKTVTAASNHMSAALSVLAYQLVVLATPTVTAFFGAVTAALTVLTAHMDILIPVMAALAVIVGGLLVTALGALIDMMIGIIATSLAITGPLALIVGISIALAMGFHQLIAASAPLSGLFAVTASYAGQLGAMINGALNGAIRAAGPLLQSIGSFINNDVLPSLRQMTSNLLVLVNGGLSAAISGFDGFMAGLRPLGAFITGTVVPALMNFALRAIDLGRLLSGVLLFAVQALGPVFSHIGALLGTLGNAFMAMLPVLTTIGSYFGGLLVDALNQAGRALIALGGWILTNVVPPLIVISTNVVRFATVLLGQVVPAVQGFLVQLQPLGTFIMGTVVPAIGQFITQGLHVASVISANLLPILGHLTDAIKFLAPVVASIAVAFAAVQFGTIVAGFGTVVAVISVGLIPAIATAVASFAGIAVAAALAAAPFIAIGAAIALLVLGFIHVVQTSAPLQAMFRAVWRNILDLWGVIQSQLVPVFQQLWSSIQSQLVPAWQQLMAALTPLLPVLDFLGKVVGAVVIVALITLVGIIAGVITALGQFLRGAIQVVAGVIQIFAGLVAFFANLLNLIVAVFTGHWDQIDKITYAMGENLRTILSGAWNVILGLTRAIFGTIIGFISGFVDSVIRFFQHLSSELVGHSIWPDMLNAMLSTLTAWASNVLSSIGSFVASVVTWFMNLGARALAAWNSMISSVRAAISSFVASTLAQIVSFVSQIIAQFDNFRARAVAAMQQAWANIVSAVNGGVSNVKGLITGFVAWCASILGGMAATAFGWGSSMMSGFAAGVQSAGQLVIGAATNIAATVAGLLHHSTPDTGPLAGDDKWMPDFGDMLASGLNDQVSKVGRAATNMAVSIQGAAPSPSDVARYSSPTSNVAQTDPATLAVLQAILSELQAQRQSGGGRMSIGHMLPSTALGSVQQNFGNGGSGVGAAHEQYQQLNTLAGIAYENSIRGAITGLGV